MGFNALFKSLLELAMKDTSSANNLFSSYMLKKLALLGLIYFTEPRILPLIVIIFLPRYLR